MIKSHFSAPVFRYILLILFVMISGWMVSCAGAVASSNTPYLQTTIFKEALDNARLTPTLSAADKLQTRTSTQVPSKTLLPSLTVSPSKVSSPTKHPTRYLTSTPKYSPTVPTLPPAFQSTTIKQNITPQAYIEDVCEYLKLRWNPENSSPGTIVMPVMYHSITGDNEELVADGSQIHESDLKYFVDRAIELGFDTITTEQLVRFLEQNEKIPTRSMILILDDRRPGVARVTFYPYLIENNWTLTLGWLIGDTDQRAATYLSQYPNETYKTLWEQIEAYYDLGVFDIQAHGYIHNINADDTSTDDFLIHELVDSRHELQEHFYCKDPSTGNLIENCDTDQPLAYIWPGGGFSKRAVEIARESGFHVGFTTNPRGPIMFNWIPLANEIDPNTPYWLPEIPMDDPLMVLPRYWSSDAVLRLDDVVAISNQAIEYAEEYKEVELAYLQNNCHITYSNTSEP